MNGRDREDMRAWGEHLKARLCAMVDDSVAGFTSEATGICPYELRRLRKRLQGVANTHVNNRRIEQFVQFRISG